MTDPILSRHLAGRALDLAGRALDLAVARAEGLVYADGWLVRPSRCANGRWKGEHTMPLADYRPSQDWELAGPIIAREQISVCCGSRGWEAYKGYGLWPGGRLIWPWHVPRGSPTLTGGWCARRGAQMAGGRANTRCPWPTTARRRTGIWRGLSSHASRSACAATRTAGWRTKTTALGGAI